jgi:asparagine synthase (glutamine-hydrolysing)
VKANPATVADFLLTGVHVQSAETFFAGVSELDPGCFLVYDVGSDQCEIEQWYHLLDGVEKKALNEQSDAEAVAELRDLLEDAVRLRLRSDVRVGTCLSGGLDSSSIALLAAQMQRMASNQLFTAVTAVSEDPRNSEEDYAEKVVRAGSLDWVKTRPSYDDFQDLLPRVIEHQEEPFASPSVCMQAFVMQAAAERGIVVLLDGQGGDETLLGYDKYYPAYCVALWQEGGAREVLQGVLRSMRSNVNMRPWRFAAHCLFALVSKARHLYYIQRAGYLTSRPPLPEWVRQFSAACFEMRRLQALEVGTTSLPALLRYEDKNSMAWSIEARLPFLDYRLVEMAVALAAGLKIRNGWTKWALRSAMRDILPHEIAWRRNKIGFEAPNDLWLARHLETMTEKVRRSHLIGRFCNVDRLMQCYRTLDHNSQWRLYSLALWEEHFGVQA